jgi:hypothetical protein
MTSKAFGLAQLGNAYADGALSNRNRIINGAMQVAQRGTSVSDLGATEGYYTVDRFQLGVGGTATAGRLTMSQDSDAPEGFGSSLKLDCTTADTSIAADENLRVVTVLEGQNLQAFKKGTANAESITLSFYVKGDASATYVIELFDTDNSRHICSTFPVTTSWERVEITFAGDTTGAFGNDNGGSLRLHFWLHAGSNYNSGTLATAWAANNNVNRAVGADSFYDSTNRVFQITGVQLEAGDTATPFEHRSYGQELALCQRYYYKHADHSWFNANANIGVGFYYSSSEIMTVVPFPVSMRTQPSLEQGSGTNYYALQRDGTTDGFNSFTLGSTTFNTAKLSVSSNVSGTAGVAGQLQTETNGVISFDAEL